jgi:hypothetical protein
MGYPYIGIGDAEGLKKAIKWGEGELIKIP